jgi:hypothetical protein
MEDDDHSFSSSALPYILYRYYGSLDRYVVPPVVVVAVTASYNFLSDAVTVSPHSLSPA